MREVHCLDCRVPLPARDMLYHIIRRHPLRARSVLAHIRQHYATQAKGARALAR